MKFSLTAKETLKSRASSGCIKYNPLKFKQRGEFYMLRSDLHIYMYEYARSEHTH